MAFAPKQDCSVDSYYAINRILLLCVGLWPYQKSNWRYIIITFLTIIFISSIVFQLTTFITTQYNTDILLHVLAYSVPWLAYTLKYNVLCLNLRHIRDLMDLIYYDWNELNNVQELEIIKKYSALGRFITLITTLFIYISISCFVLILFLSNFLLNIPTTMNESHPRQLPVLMEYFVDQQRYFVPIFVHICIVIVCGLTTVAATETLFMSYIQHTCGLFEIASYRIEQALHKDTIQGITSFTKINLVICQGIINGFYMYKKAIEFIEILKTNCKLAYSLLMPLGVLSLSVNLYRLSRLIMSKEYYEMIISFMFIVGHFWYMFFCNYIGQELIDHSSDIFYRIYNVRWYVAPLRAQKLLLLVMQRSMRHCTIVIDGLFIPSLEGFATLTSMSISYFAMILSLF
ncbi:hypothetical protein P5V15_004487 [Pogonomyrmex californicus]